MTDLDELIRQLSRMKVQTGSLVCLGCGLEHNCGIHGCAVLRRAVSAVRELAERRAKAVRPADTDPALIAALRCSATVGGDKDCAHCAYGQRTGDLLSPDDPPVLRLLEDEYYCDCDRMALDAVRRLEELTGVDGNG